MLKKLCISLLLLSPLLAHDGELTLDVSLESVQKLRLQNSRKAPSERIARVPLLNIPTLRSPACTNFLEFGLPSPSQDVDSGKTQIKSRIDDPDERITPIPITNPAPRVSSLNLFQKVKPTAADKTHDFARKPHFTTCPDLIDFKTFDVQSTCSVASFGRLEATLQRSDDDVSIPTLKRAPAFKFPSKEHRKKSAGIPIKNCYISIRPSPATRSTIINSKIFEEFVVRQHLNVNTGKVEEFPAVESTINGRVQETLVFKNLSDAEKYVRRKEYKGSDCAP